MKKLIFATLMLLSASATFAGDSEPLKTVLKARSYAEAAELVKANLGQLTGNAEKAKAYDKLYQLAMKKVSAEQGVQLKNQANQQMGKEGSKAIGEKGLYEAVGQAFGTAEEVVKCGNMPNAKGKVKPRYTGIADELYPLRGQLINGDIFYQGAKDDANAYKYLARYVDSADEPMFSKFNKSEDENLNEVAYFATYYAYQNKDYKKAEKYAEYAVKSKDRNKDAKQLQLAIMGTQLNNHQDSVAYADKLADIYAQDPDNDAVLTTLTSIYSSLGIQDKAEEIVNAALTKNPNSYGALVMLGQFANQKKEYEKAADYLSKALALAKDDNAKIAINASIGQCWFYKAQDRVAAVKDVLSPAAHAQFNDVYNKAVSYLETAKNLDVMKEHKSSWAYPLYGCYYFVKGARTPETLGAAAVADVQQ